MRGVHPDRDADPRPTRRGGVDDAANNSAQLALTAGRQPFRRTPQPRAPMRCSACSASRSRRSCTGRRWTTSCSVTRCSSPATRSAGEQDRANEARQLGGRGVGRRDAPAAGADQRCASIRLSGRVHAARSPTEPPRCVASSRRHPFQAPRAARRERAIDPRKGVRRRARRARNDAGSAEAFGDAAQRVHGRSLRLALAVAERRAPPARRSQGVGRPRLSSAVLGRRRRRPLAAQRMRTTTRGVHAARFGGPAAARHRRERQDGGRRSVPIGGDGGTVDPSPSSKHGRRGRSRCVRRGCASRPEVVRRQFWELYEGVASWGRGGVRARLASAAPRRRS